MKTEKGEGAGWSGSGDPPPGVWVADPKIEKVSHRGLIYPASFRWTWTRISDGLVVLLEVRMDPEAGPVLVEVTVRAEEGIDSGGHRQPVASMARTAAAQYAVRSTETAPGTYRVSFVSGPVAMGRVTKRTDQERLERIAELYRKARAEGRGVTELIEEAEGVSDKTAYGLIRKARKAGLLPPSRPGRKARITE